MGFQVGSYVKCVNDFRTGDRFAYLSPSHFNKYLYPGNIIRVTENYIEDDEEYFKAKARYLPFLGSVNSYYKHEDFKEVFPLAYFRIGLAVVLTVASLGFIGYQYRNQLTMQNVIDFAATPFGKVFFGAILAVVTAWCGVANVKALQTSWNGFRKSGTKRKLDSIDVQRKQWEFDTQREAHERELANRQEDRTRKLRQENQLVAEGYKAADDQRLQKAIELAMKSVIAPNEAKTVSIFTLTKGGYAKFVKNPSQSFQTPLGNVAKQGDIVLVTGIGDGVLYHTSSTGVTMTAKLDEVIPV